MRYTYDQPEYLDVDGARHLVQELKVYIAEKTLIHTLSETEINETMGSNHEYRCQEVVSLTLALPEDVPNDYISSIIFTSGATATNLIYPDTVKMVGEGCIDGVFAPSENKRYNIIISYDGVNCVGGVGGYEV